MKIFEFQVNGEKEWVAANTIIQAFETYCNLTGMGLWDFESGDDVVEIPESKWGEYYVNHEEPYSEEDNLEPFSEVVKRMTSPDIIASTAY